MMQVRWLLVAIVAAVSLVVSALLLDVRREFEAAIRNLEDEQISLATAVGADFETRLHRMEDEGAIDPSSREFSSVIPQLLGGALKLEQRGSRMLLVGRPDQARLYKTNGERVTSPTLSEAMRADRRGVIVPREESPAFGLPRRISVAGLERLEARSGSWGIVVLASAERLRARERYAQLRFLLSVGLVIAVMTVFGGMAVRQERRKLEVARELEVSALERERERLLAKADKMATLAALSSGIAHEVATPLSTIMARVEQVLPANAHDERASAALRVALTQVERIQTVIRGVLGLARGEMPPLVPADPGAIANGAVGLTLHRFEQAGVVLELELGPDLPQIACDPPMLEQALTNLLLNACDASARGSIVRLSVRSQEAMLSFSVEDEGEGITAETVARAQEPFFTTKPRDRGNGLGLAISREVVAHHGGKLHLRPREATRGTQALIQLPRL